MAHATVSDLTAHPLFADLPVPAVASLSEFTYDIVFEPGQAILTEGAPASTVYLLREGKVTLSAHAPGKGHLLVQTIGPGEVLGLSWLFPPFRWKFDARAIDSVSALAIDGPSLLAKLDEDPALGYEVLKRLVPVVLNRLQQTRVRLLDLYNSGG